MEKTEQKISELENRTTEITQSEQKREKRLKTNEQSHKDEWNYNKSFKICVIKVPEGEEKEGQTNYSKELMDENLPNLAKHLNLKIHEVERTQGKTQRNQEPSQSKF